MLANIVISFFGAIVFLFIFWKFLKEDYVSEIIFKLAFYILVGQLILYLLSFRFFPQWFLWASFGGSLLGLSFGIFTLRVRFYEALEALVVAFLPWIALMFLGDSVINSSLISFLSFVATLVIVFLSYWLGDHYKDFAWYKSGKIGFAGLATLAVIFLTRSTIAIFGIHVLSFVGQRYEAIVSATLAFICFLLIFNLGRDQA